MRPVALCAALLALAARGTALEAPPMPEAFRVSPAAVRDAARTATSARFPDADAVVVAQHDHTRYEADGSATSWQDAWIKILTEKGRRAFAAEEVAFNARYGAAGFLAVEILATNGVLRAVDFARTLKTTTDNASLAANIVDPLERKSACRASGLAVGEVRHVVTWERQTKPILRGAWADATLFERALPILSHVRTVDAPAALPLRHAAVRNALSNTLVRTADRPLDGGARRLARWEARDVPQVFAEPRMPPAANCLQRLQLSTLPDWPAVSRWYWGVCAPHLAHVTPAMTNRIAALTRGCATREARLRALFRFVSQEVRYMGLTLEADVPGFEPHDVNVTFENRYGVCRDKAALLVALLRTAGFESYPVLIHAGAKMDPEVPTPYFNHAIVAVARAPGDYTLMDPTDESTKDLLPSYLANRSYLVARPQGDALRTSPAPDAARNQLTVRSTGALDADGRVLLTSTFDATGIADTILRGHFLRQRPEERRRTVRNLLRAVSAEATLLDCEITPRDLRDTDAPLAVKTVARLGDLVLRGQTRDTLTPPFVTAHALNIAASLLDENTALETRRFPLRLPVTARVVETFDLKLADGADARLALPADIALTNAPGYSFRRTLKREDGVLKGRREACVAALDFPVAVYGALRAARQEEERLERIPPSFRAREDAEANVRIRAYARAIRLRTPHAWTATNTSVREVLTYAGKKAEAERTFSFAPETRAVTFVSGSVSNRDGRVLAVTPREVNLLDADWAASAPRYPASKKLVVNFPGVEIGSVIRCTWAEVVTNAPTPFTLAHAFGARDPVDAEEVSVEVPRGVPFALQRADIARPAPCTVTTNAASRLFRWALRDVPRIPNETLLPPQLRWRPGFAVSCADYADYATSLNDALRAARERGSGDVTRAARAWTVACTTPEARITALRTQLRRVAVRGPGLLERPFDRAFTPPDRVLAEGYGSRTDRQNLFRAALEAAGFACSFVLAANDAGTLRESEAARREAPWPDTFATPVIRAAWRTGLWPFNDAEQVFWVGDENEYAPPGTSAHAGDACLDLETATFGRIPDGAEANREDNYCWFDVRANGAVDAVVSNCSYGVQTGALRKRFAELLDEKRRRYHQQLLGGIARNATATRELVTDIASYPFVLSLGCYAEGYAVSDRDTLTLEIPDFTGRLFALAEEPTRRAPIAVGAADETTDTYTIRFPRGYVRAEALPPPLEIRSPVRPEEVWLAQTTQTRVEDGALVVTVRRTLHRRDAVQLPPAHQALLADWNRRAAARAQRTLVVRRADPGTR